MRVLVACEFSGTVRAAFRARGHDAWSCDLLPAADSSPFHFQCDVREILAPSWDLMIAHPECTYLTNSAAWAFKEPDFNRYPGVGYHQRLKPGTLTGKARLEARDQAVEFALVLWTCSIPRIVIENPTGHLSQHLGKSQLIQPYNFGADASKGTCLWLKGVPPLIPTQYVHPRMVEHEGKMVKRWSNQTSSGQNKLTPSDLRWAIRSVTYPGIADAMADQWGLTLAQSNQQEASAA